MTSFKQYCTIAFVVILAMGAGRMLLPSYTEYNKTRQQLHEEESNLLKQQVLTEALREKNYKLQTDSRAIERVAREKFGWSRTGEKIYDFGDKSSGTAIK